MKKLLTQTKILVTFLILILIGSFASILYFSFSSANVHAVSVESDLNVRVGEVLSLSLTNCDATNNSTVSVNVTPSTTGTFKSNCQTVTVDTNNPGYSLTAKSSSSELLYQNPTTISSLPEIPSTGNSIISPATLTNDIWGFAVEAMENSGFDTTYAIDNASNKYAALPTDDTTIYQTNVWPLPKTNHKFFYATRLTPEIMAGTYATTITYTAIGEEVLEPICHGDSVICIEVTNPGILALQNIWQDSIHYAINGSSPITLTSETLSSDISVEVGDIIEISENTNNVSFRSWSCNVARGFITNTILASTARVSITKIPSMSSFTTNNTGLVAGDCFFRYFIGTSSASYPAAINSIPEDSFDIGNITTTGDYFFNLFNHRGLLTSLPNESFNTSNITSVGDYFFSSFNQSGALTSLPNESFNTSNITSVEERFFYQFNYIGALTFLPANSFDIRKITSTEDYFFTFFNYNGALTSLPVGSFNTSNITTVGDAFFQQFNYNGALTSLPVGSFNTSNITTVGNSFFSYFNYAGKISSLPINSFVVSNITSAGDNFFLYFNGSTNANAGGLQAGAGVTIINKSSSSITFWQRPNGNPDGDAFSTSVPVGDEITYLAE